MPRCCFENSLERHAVLGVIFRILSPWPSAQREDPELDSLSPTALFEDLELDGTTDPTAPD